MHGLNVVLRVHDLCKLIYNSTFFFKLLPQLFQNIQACLFNIDLKTKLRTRTWQKDCFNEHKLLWNHLHVFEQVLLTDQPFTAFISSSWLFITIGNMPSSQSHWNIKYYMYQNTSVFHSPSFYAPEIKYCFSPVCPLTFLISFEGKMFEILFFGVNVDTLKGMFLLGIWETAQPNMQKGYWMPTLLLKK